MSETADDLLTTSQAAALAGVTKQTIYLACVHGRIPYTRVADPTVRAHGGGATFLLRRADIARYIAERTARKNRVAMTGAERARRFQARRRAEAPPPEEDPAPA